MSQENRVMSYMEEDTIDLRELWKTLMKCKLMIVFVTLLMTSSAVIYVQMAKPIYSGSVMLETGVVANEQFNDEVYASKTIIPLDNVDNLKTIVSKTLGVSASVPKKTSLILVTSIGLNKDEIRNKLEKTVQFILERHKQMAELYSGEKTKIKMTQVIGNITVSDRAIKPKKKLIVAVSFITGLILSVFLAFFLEFIQGGHRKDELD